jgi:purine-nucleoside phosphorylase
VPTTSPNAPGANPFEQARLAARELSRVAGVDHYDVVVVLGTGLFGVAEALGAQGPAVDLTSLPWFVRFTGPAHRPEAWSVTRGGIRLLVVAGRLHLYEGRTPAEVVHLVRTAIATGVHTVVLTCSAGAVNPAYAVGDVVAIRDHLNLTGVSPLTGVAAALAPSRGPAPGAAPGPPATRHVDLTDAWSPRLRALLHEVTPGLPEGVYAQLAGPELETPAEIRMLATLGADLVGMSTAGEAIAARHLGAEVLGLAVVTNAAAGMAPGGVDVDAVVRAATAASGTVARLLGGVLDRIAAGAIAAAGEPA